MEYFIDRLKYHYIMWETANLTNVSCQQTWLVKSFSRYWGKNASDRFIFEYEMWFQIKLPTPWMLKYAEVWNKIIHHITHSKYIYYHTSIHDFSRKEENIQSIIWTNSHFFYHNYLMRKGSLNESAMFV